MTDEELSIGTGPITLTGLTGPINFTFCGKEGVLFTIKSDGTIERGPSFTTTDAASLEFWDALQRMGFKLTGKT